MPEAANFGRETGTAGGRDRAFVTESTDRERTTAEIGELIMDRLKGLDTVAYTVSPAFIGIQGCR